jgi:predicted Zn-dependent protease
VPSGRSVWLAPLGDVPESRLGALASFYEERYGLSTSILSPTSVDFALDPARGQLVAETVIDVLRSAYPIASEPRAVVIGVTDQDLYLLGVPQWAWAFGMRKDGHLGVISTFHMKSFGPFAQQVEASRMRKMVTKYIGLMFFGLSESEDPGSAVYGRILSVADLDRIGEEF